MRFASSSYEYEEEPDKVEAPSVLPGFTWQLHFA